MILFRYLPALALVLIVVSGSLATQTISGELKTWHKITLAFDGPSTSETATPNPFTDYDLRVTFTQGNDSFVVPGYFAADGNAAETGATSGNQWLVHFAPNETGSWNYSVSFKTGADVAMEGGGTTAGFMDGTTGSFSVAATDKSGRDHRGMGRLEYVGEHYLRYAESGEWFLKAGADAPENTLAYEDFDAVPNVGNRRKNWQPHQQDYNATDAAAYTWQNGRGSELLGVVNYLANKGVNAFSFLTFNVEGDDKNVFPHLYTDDVSNYNGNNSWSNDANLQHDRFDVSRMAQWERIFGYADLRGMYLHFKTQETENDDLMDGGDLGRERKLYYRELIARYSHHLALNWNMGEENVQSTQQRRDMASYFAANDPYQHLRVIHTYPGQKNQVYTPLLGTDSEYTGLSMQTSNDNQQQTHSETDEWVGKSANANKKWVVAVDEPGNASIGVDADPDARKKTRHRVVWGNLMAGGAGTEFYYGYQSGCGDLQCQDHRSRDQKYTDAAIAIAFFQDYFQPHLPDVFNDNSLTVATDDYVLYNPGNAYLVYRPDGGTTTITLPAGEWEVSWFNPRDGSMNPPFNLSGNQLSAPDNEDWVALILPGTCVVGTACNDGDDCTTNDSFDAECNCGGLFEDEDNDGVCDAEDLCPSFDDSLIGTPCDDNDPATMNDQFTTDCICAGSLPGPNTDFWLEAECGNYGSAWQENTDPNASAGNYLLASGATSFLENPPADTDYHLTFRVAVPITGDYRIYARTFTTEDGDDSVWIRSGCGGWNRWNKINHPYGLSDYAWEQAGDWVSGDASNPVTFALEKGVNLIEIGLREPGIQLDKLFITLDGNEPTGSGQNATNCNPVCNPGTTCDDGDATTNDDTFDDNCECAGITPNCNALPVEWGHFTAELIRENDVRLSWTTLKEVGTESFKILELDGNTATLLAIKNANGFSETITDYTYVDANVAPGMHYYQIEQVDLDGKTSLTGIRSIRVGESTIEPLVFPNPGSGRFQLLGQDSFRSVIATDIAGRSVQLRQINNSNLFEITSPAKGIYYLRIVDATGQTFVRKLLVQ